MLIIVPFRGGEPWRDHAFEYVTDWYSPREMVLANSPTKMFNKSLSINDAVKESEDDLFAMIDADTLISSDLLVEGVKVAEETGGLVVPFNQLRMLTENGTRYVYENNMDPYVVPNVVTHSVNKAVPLVGGVNIFTRELWESVGGFPEQFEGWGGEDIWWAETCKKHRGIHRLEGVAVHLWHPKRGEYYSTDTINRNDGRLRQR